MATKSRGRTSSRPSAAKTKAASTARSKSAAKSETKRTAARKATAKGASKPAKAKIRTIIKNNIQTTNTLIDQVRGSTNKRELRAVENVARRLNTTARARIKSIKRGK